MSRRWSRSSRTQDLRNPATERRLSETERDELTRLRRENAELKLDREVLRKAAAYFAKEQR